MPTVSDKNSDKKKDAGQGTAGSSKPASQVVPKKNSPPVMKPAKAYPIASKRGRPRHIESIQEDEEEESSEEETALPTQAEMQI